VTAVPAVHGPEDGERDAAGFVNCEVIGFVLSGQDLRVVYVSGDNASIATVTEITRRAPAIDAAVPHTGAARVPGKFRDRPLSLDSIWAAAAAAVLGPAVVMPAHYDGWAHFSEPQPSDGFVTTPVSQAASGPAACAAMGCAGGRTRNPGSGASRPTSSECREESLCIVVSFVAP
jgi:hypothetical protein